MDNCVMPFCSKKRNILSSENYPKIANACFNVSFYVRNMASQPHHDWFLADWLKSLAVRQARMMELTGWDKRKTSELVTGKQRYNRDIINEAAAALNLQPFELLMHPADAMAMRRFRDSALQSAAETRRDYDAEPVGPIRAGGNG